MNQENKELKNAARDREQAEAQARLAHSAATDPQSLVKEEADPISPETEDNQ
jgi:hypothetical protein